jgi:hypothetical protein
MPAEEFTHTGTDVADRIRAQFGDTSGAQVADAAIIRWINDGQREIVNSNPILRATKTTDYIAGQQDYSFPTDKVLVIEAIYINGYPITAISPQEAREYIKTKDPLNIVNSPTPDVWWERAGIISFYPVADTTVANGLKLEYIKVPTSITAFADILSIPDRYFNELVNYVTAQALELDENYSAAAVKTRQFRDGLDRLSQKDAISNSDSYMSIMPDPQDF